MSLRSTGGMRVMFNRCSAGDRHPNSERLNGFPEPFRGLTNNSISREESS